MLWILQLTHWNHGRVARVYTHIAAQASGFSLFQLIPVVFLCAAYAFATDHHLKPVE